MTHPKSASPTQHKRSERRSHLDKRCYPDSALAAFTGLVHRVSEDLTISTHPDVLLLLGALRARQWERAVDHADAILKQSYEDKGQYMAFAQLSHMVRKVPLGDPTLPESRALAGFKAAEHRCRRVNQRLRISRVLGRNPHEGVFKRARAWILRVLGESPDVDAILSQCGFGPGVSIGVSGDNTHFQRKLEVDEITVTPTCAPYFHAAVWAHAQYRATVLPEADQFSYNPGRIYCNATRAVFADRLDRRIAHVSANKIAFVPKTAKIHRTIAVEPLGNSFVQKGVDRFMRDRLQAVGIDLSDQTLNQRLARQGSLGGFDPYVTLDLSAASDSVSIEIVRELLPAEWFTFLNCIRSPAYVLPGSETSERYHKFVSMGNGFCFPLETLIFASLAWSCGAETGHGMDFSVYGDDIIVRQGSALYLTEVLSWCGFRVNRSKSFYFGPFRESCGADYWSGDNVRPFVLDSLPLNCRDWIKICNGLRTSCVFSALDGAWSFALSQIHPKNRLLRPEDGPPDGAVTVSLDVFMASKAAHWRRDLHRWNWQEFVSTAVDDVSQPEQRNAVRLYGLLSGSLSREDASVQTPLRRQTRTRRRWVLPALP